jgi:hypothetical protein
MVVELMVLFYLLGLVAPSSEVKIPNGFLREVTEITPSQGRSNMTRKGYPPTYSRTRY